MTAEAMQGIDWKADAAVGDGDSDRSALRRVVWVALGLYLAPAALVVLLVAGLGMACCAAAKWLGGPDAPQPDTPRPDGLRIDGPTTAVGTPHTASPRVRSPRR